MPKFLSSTEHNGDIIDINNNSGTAGQILSSLGAGNGIDWINQADITIGEAEIAKTLQVTVKNVSGGELAKGTVVHVSPSANPPSGNVIEVIAADYDDATKMPAVGILKETIANEAEGEAVMAGALSGIATDGFTPGDELYVGADGALTNTKPQTAGQLIQKIAVCVKSHESNGLIKIFGAGRSNDVPLPLYIDNTNQRVGIGEPSPGAKLDVNGDLKANTYASIQGVDSGNPTAATDELRVSGYGIMGNRGSLYFTNSNAGGSIQFGIGGAHAVATKMYINPGGNVGIGTTDPDGSLNIKSVSATGSHYNLLSQNNSGTQLFYVRNDGVVVVSNNYFYVTSTQGAYVDGSIKARGGITDDGGTLGLGGGGSTNHLNILSGGNVGIGTTSPERLLSLYSNNAETTPRFLIEQDGTGDAVMAFSLSGGQGWSMGIDNSLSDSFMIHNSAGGVDSSSQFTINTSGDVGIGTTSPTHKLQVVGNGAFNSTLSVQDPAVSSNGLLQLSHDSTGSSLYSNPASSNVSTVVLRLGINYSEKMRIANNGNVGIGTTSPGEKLDVNGNISHKGLTMTEGTDVDQIKTFTMTYQLAANTWTDTGINSDDLSTGTYIMQVYADDSSAGASHYDEYYSATISWFGTATNSTVVDEIVVHRAGHAPNDSDLQFRTVRHSSGGDNLMLQVKTNNDHTLAMNNTNGRRHTYKFRRLI